ncbi:thioredoxin domain-containing protein [Candidatus Saccharibacteria bacterium]|nr:thioredoxin domain-containing protein [Candidatus Saccharibacteria bacterium]
MDKRFLTILAAIVVIFGSIFIFSQRSSNSSGGSTLGSQTQLTNHVRGQGQKGVTLVEYGDFQCSACFSFEPVIKEVVEKYSNDIYFQFRNLPLVQLHPNAFAAARAAEAASLQNKYWEMHDILYDSSNWQTWTNSVNARILFDSYAQKLGLNMEQFKQDYGSSKVNDAINADLAEFKKTRQPMSTPTFFLNGTYLDTSKLTDQNNRPSFEKFKVVLDAEIAKEPSRQ